MSNIRSANLVRSFLAGALALALPCPGTCRGFEEGLAALEQIRSSGEDRSTRVEASPLSGYLKPATRTTDEDGNEFLTYALSVGDRRVFGETITVVYPAGVGAAIFCRPEETLRAQFGELVDLESRRLVTEVPLERAQQIAAQHVRSIGEASAQEIPDAWLKDPDLVYFRPQEQPLRLAHHLTLPVSSQGFPTTREFFIDAGDGRILATFALLYDLKGSLRGTGYGLRSSALREFPITQAGAEYALVDEERNLSISRVDLGTSAGDDDKFWDRVGTTSDRAASQRAEVELYLNFLQIVDFYKQRWDYTWAGQVRVVAHVNDPRTGQSHYDNAYFSPQQNAFFFGDGSGSEGGFDYLGKALDVAGHEFGHGFINAEGPLTYFGEPGALNEHIADLFGVCVDDGDWLLGNDIMVGSSVGKGLRNMKDPGNTRGHLITPEMTYMKWRQLNSSQPLGDRIYPDHLTRKIVCQWHQDNGGVHVNSSIFNKFAYLAASGEGLGSEGLGRQLLADIYVKAMKGNLYSENATFQEFRDAIKTAAGLVLAADPKRDIYQQTIQKAFAAIGL